MHEEFLSEQREKVPRAPMIKKLQEAIKSIPYLKEENFPSLTNATALAIVHAQAQVA